jgi:hypothetical protein
MSRVDLTKNVVFRPQRGKDLQIDILTRTENTVVHLGRAIRGVAREAIASGRIPIVSRNGGVHETCGR